MGVSAMLTLKLDLSPWIKLTDDQFYELCQHHPDYKFERNAKGELLMVPPTGQGKRIMSTSGNFTVLVATIIDSCSLLKRYLTADSGGYSSKHYYYSPGNLDAFALGRPFHPENAISTENIRQTHSQFG